MGLTLRSVTGALKRGWGVTYDEHQRALARILNYQEQIKLSGKSNETLRRRILQLDEEKRDLQERLTLAESRVALYSGQIAQVRAVMTRVPVFEDSGLALATTVELVGMLAQDHDELESRIDAVVSYLTAQRPGATDSLPDIIGEVARLLQGGSRVPDSPEGIEG